MISNTMSPVAGLGVVCLPRDETRRPTLVHVHPRSSAPVYLGRFVAAARFVGSKCTGVTF